MRVEWRTYRTRHEARPGLHGVSVWWDGVEPVPEGTRWWTHFRCVWSVLPGWKPIGWVEIPDDASGVTRRVG